jgi:signal transduction histidine kinase/ActR/RegA family two-component response regulator
VQASVPGAGLRIFHVLFGLLLIRKSRPLKELSRAPGIAPDPGSTIACPRVRREPFRKMSRLEAVPSPGHEHRVQFYEDSGYLLDEVGRYLAEGLGEGEAGVAIATGAHRESLELRLARLGVDLEAVRRSGRYVSLDASETLSRFRVGGSIDRRLFRQVIEGVLSRATQPHRGVRLYGEMVAVLWSQGDRRAAVELEELWNELGRRHLFSLLCSYPIGQFSDESHEQDFRDICAAHTEVVPAESFTVAARSEEGFRSIALLQQKAEALETEVVRRRQVESELQAKISELAEADRRKDEFLAMLGHELRNPLSPIVTSLHLLGLRGDDPKVVSRSIAVIERQTQRLIRLVDDLLDVSRITRGTIGLREEAVTVTDLVEKAVEQVRPLLEERGHRLVLDLPEEPLIFRADPARLEQAIGNLVANAARYTNIGGRIEVSARRDGSDLVISVRDDGIGLDADSREQIFELFVQGPNSAARPPGGLGVGLTVVRRLVQLHGGTVEAFSDGPGRGSEFIVRLPLRFGPDDLPDPVTLPVASSRVARRRILVVDDNVDAADGLTEMLRSLGHDVSAAREGLAALEQARHLRPEIVFLDLAMPGIDGREVARRLRAEAGLSSTRIVAVTGFGRESDRLLSLEAGFDDHLVKPLELERLNHLLGSSDARSEIVVAPGGEARS